MPTLLIDNHDSNTFNLFQLLAQLEDREPVVVRNDEDGWEDIDLRRFSKIVISAGPGRPERPRDFGLSSGALAASEVPLLGVCLGHQGLVLAHGGALHSAPRPMHGRRSRIFHSGAELFEGIPQGFLAVRYHSLAVPEPLPDSLEVIARTSSGTVMAVRHRTLPHWGVQFHPESVQTESGAQLLRNFLHLAEARRARARPIAAARTARREAARVPRRQLAVIVETVDAPVDSESAFVQLYGDAETAFWLDSSSHATGMGHYSYMGAGGGPLSRLVTHRVGSDVQLFDALDEALGQIAAEGRDFFCGGFVGYLGYELKTECGAVNEHRSPHPDAMLLFADRLIAFDHRAREAHVICLSERDGVAAARGWAAATAERLRALGPAAPPRAGDPGGSTAFSLRRGAADYLRDIETCQEHLAEGESYEICLTNELHARARVDALAVHRVLRRINPAPFAAFLRLGGVEVASSSPERFLSLTRDGVLEAKPIKGTAARGATPSEDREAAARLRSAAKDRAENLMIVDVLRNDLGRVAEIGSVSVPTLMGVESYATVHQLVSTIRARLREDATLGECLRACFPGGSMTGAPKPRTMEIIDRLEGRPRGIYSGAIGYLGVDGSADLSIAIRTIVSSGHGTTIGAGGAITVESDPRGELRELLLKARAPLEAVGLALHGRRDAAVVESARRALAAAG
ncbi:MAG TPA: aminodeoxychorismate synthase component I [Solirubrobacteraceae bacterium]